MIRLCALLLVVLVLTGFGPCSRVVQPSRPQAVPAQCDAQCYVPCDTRVPAWAPVDPDSPEAWAELGEQVLAPAKGKLDRCELQRKSCHQCLDRLKREGVLL